MSTSEKVGGKTRASPLEKVRLNVPLSTHGSMPMYVIEISVNVQQQMTGYYVTAIKRDRERERARVAPHKS